MTKNSESFQSFTELSLPEGLIHDLVKLGFNAPTPIQAASIPHVLAGKDLLALAPTGTGKTGAYGIPAIALLSTQKDKQVLILAPTRELAAQIFKFMEGMSGKLGLKGALLVGGESFRQQFFAWHAGADYLVATPGRLMDHVSRGLDLSHVGMLVLDEVDRMLDMGFAPQVEEVVKGITGERQTLLFSATMPREIQNLANRYLKEPVRVTVGGKPEDAPKIKEEKIRINRYDKPAALLEQIRTREGKILIFARTQIGTDRVAEQLEAEGIETARLHGGRNQNERRRALDAFRIGRVRVLAATDIAARGIDVPDIEVVINYDFPATKEDYLHRIGRTGRYGKEGVAISFVEGGGGGGHPSHKSAGRRPFKGGGRSRGFTRNFEERESEVREPNRFGDRPRRFEERSERPVRNFAGPTARSFETPAPVAEKPVRNFEGPRPERSFDGPKRERRFEGPKRERSFDGPKRERRFEGPKRERSFDGPKRERKFEGPKPERKVEAPKEAAVETKVKAPVAAAPRENKVFGDRPPTRQTRPFRREERGEFSGREERRPRWAQSREFSDRPVSKRGEPKIGQSGDVRYFRAGKDGTDAHVPGFHKRKHAAKAQAESASKKRTAPSWERAGKNAVKRKKPAASTHVE